MKTKSMLSYCDRAPCLLISFEISAPIVRIANTLICWNLFTQTLRCKNRSAGESKTTRIFPRRVFLKHSVRQWCGILMGLQNVVHKFYRHPFQLHIYLSLNAHWFRLQGSRFYCSMQSARLCRVLFLAKYINMFISIKANQRTNCESNQAIKLNINFHKNTIHTSAKCTHFVERMEKKITDDNCWSCDLHFKRIQFSIKRLYLNGSESVSVCLMVLRRAENYCDLSKRS